MNTIQVKRYNSQTGALIGEITESILNVETQYRLVGGCYSASFSVIKDYTDGLVCNKNEEIKISSGNVDIFSGIVEEVSPEFQNERQVVNCVGWWQALNEIEIVSDPISDRLVFGTADDSDQPTEKTAYAVANWIYTNRISNHTNPISLSDFQSPTYPCKFGNGGFAIYAADKIPKILETLAAMEDCVCGVDANKSLYFIPRENISTTSFSVKIGQSVPANWRTQKEIYALSGKIGIDETKGPNNLSIISRDANRQTGIRTYKYTSAENGKRRVKPYLTPNVRTGQGARRLARGLFRRFVDQAITVRDAQGVGGSFRVEPHIGQVSIDDFDDSEIVKGLAGQIKVVWEDALYITVTIGENKTDPGGGNPLNDPFAPDNNIDYSQIDTGDGSTPGFSTPSQDIDESDGWDGDGDDLHQNENRDDWTDNPSPAPGNRIDYGPDIKDPASDGEQFAAVAQQIRPGIITAVNSGTPNTYDVDEYDFDLSTVLSSHETIDAHTDEILSVDDKVSLVFGTDNEIKYILSNTGGGGGSSTTIISVSTKLPYFSA